MQKLAVIDCGTNTFHLLVVSVEDKRISTEFRLQIPVKLGEGGINQNTIQPAAYLRGMDALKIFAGHLQSLKVDKIVAFATSAIRSASNGAAFVAQAKAETGIELTTISGRREADLIFKGVSHAYPFTAANELVMDIGGGSVEFIIGNKAGVVWEGSFDIGAARLLDKFHKAEPISKQEVAALNAHLDIQLEPLRLALLQYPVQNLVGSAGSFDSLCELINDFYGSHLLEDAELWTEIPLDKYTDIHLILLNATLEDREKMPGLVDYRVEMMVVSSCLINYVLEKYHLSRMFCCTYSLKEGGLFSLLED